MTKQYKDETTRLEIALLPPSLDAELRRVIAIDEAWKQNAATPAVAMYQTWYADCVAATPSGKLTYNGEEKQFPPASFEECRTSMSLKAFLWWKDQVLAANPDWNPQTQAVTPEQEKKD